MRWALITGEYPPQPGGVSDYTRLVAQGLAAAGDEVHVWAPPGSSPESGDSRATIHRLPDHFGPRALVKLEADLDRLRRPYQMLVQYVPHAFGCKGMNVPFCWWLHGRRRSRYWVLFHEVAFPLSWRQPLSHNLLGVTNRFMAALVARSAERVFVTIPAWRAILQRLAPRKMMDWLPVPSNLPASLSTGVVAKVRGRLAPGSDPIILGHFSTFSNLVRPLLTALIPSLLRADDRRIMLLLGRGGDRFLERLCQQHPDLRERLHAPGDLSADELAAHLAACDCLVQPYPDGVSSRRGSLMAGLALGLPIVTNIGFLTESIWQGTSCVQLVSDFAPAAFITAVEALLANSRQRLALGDRAAAVYGSRFSLRHTIAALRAERTRELAVGTRIAA